MGRSTWLLTLTYNRDHLLIKDYLPTKFKASVAKPSWVISCTKLRDIHILTDLPSNMLLLLWSGGDNISASVCEHLLWYSELIMGCACLSWPDNFYKSDVKLIAQETSVRWSWIMPCSVDCSSYTCSLKKYCGTEQQRISFRSSFFLNNLLLNKRVHIIHKIISVNTNILAIYYDLKLRNKNSKI